MSQDAPTRQSLVDRLQKSAGDAAIKIPAIAMKVKTLNLALGFGHVQGFPGWLGIQTEWQPEVDGGSGETRAIFVALRRSVLAYTKLLIDEASIEAVSAYLEGLEDLFNGASSTERPLIDTAAPDCLQELERHLSTIQSRPPTKLSERWYSEWLNRTLRALREYYVRPEQNTLHDLVSIVFDRFEFPIKGATDNDIQMLYTSGTDIQRLIRRFLTTKGIDLIEPVPGFEEVRGQDCDVTGENRGGKVLKIVSRGLRDQQGVLRKAVVTVEGSTIPRPETRLA